MRFCLLMAGLFAASTGLTAAQSSKVPAQPGKKAAYYTGKHTNLFREAGYGLADIDKKVAKAYHDVFEDPSKGYFEVGDPLAYVSDVKNHDACTEGLSYGMMGAVQLNKKEVLNGIWRWSKKYLQHQDGPL